jgi:hypothetical protein
MIHAGTIRTGSANTVSVAGSYWISSIRRLRNTTLPGVRAIGPPGTKASAPTGGWPSVTRLQSSTKFEKPRTRLFPPCSRVTRSTSGLVHAMFDGAHMSSICRVAKLTSAACCGDTPFTSVVALCHHCCRRRNA